MFCKERGIALAALWGFLHLMTALCTAQTGQWSTLGTNIYNANSGGVGIGTSTPAFLLDVNGDINVSGGSTIRVGGQSALSSDGASGFNLGGGTVGKFHFFAGNGQERMTISTTGYVGIGDSSPGLNLDVNAIPSNTLANILGVFNPLSDSTHAQGSGTAIILGQSYNQYFTKIATIYESQNPDFLRPALAFYTMDSSFASGSELERMRIRANGNVGIGTSTPAQKLEVNGSIKLSAGSGGTIVFPDGTTQNTAWTGALCGGDYAESVQVSGGRTRYEPGDVLVIDPAQPGSFLKSAEPYSSTVAGIYSTKPGVVGRRHTGAESTQSEIPMAMVGIVPTKVSAENGPIRPGDLLVTSATLGHAMKGTDRSQMLGAVVGKALGSLDFGTGIIEVLVSLQ